MEVGARWRRARRHQRRRSATWPAGGGAVGQWFSPPPSLSKTSWFLFPHRPPPSPKTTTQATKATIEGGQMSMPPVNAAFVSKASPPALRISASFVLVRHVFLHRCICVHLCSTRGSRCVSPCVSSPQKESGTGGARGEGDNIRTSFSCTVSTPCPCRSLRGDKKRHCCCCSSRLPC